MSKKKLRIPSYRLHKPSGLAVVRLSGKDFYLGPYGSAQSRRQYEQVLSDWLANRRQLPRQLPGQLPEAPSTEPMATSNQSSKTINELFLDYWDHTQVYYPCRSTQDYIKLAAKPLCELFGQTCVSDFGPLRLKTVRQHMIDAYDWSRVTINKSVDNIKRMFKWGVENEIVDVTVYQALAALSGLRRGRCTARETDPVKPVPEHLIWGIEGHVSDQVWTLIMLQLHTGARPGELVVMRAIDLHMSGDVWIYEPQKHKTQYHGHARTIYIGPKAQKWIRPFLTDRPLDAYLFSPKEAESKRRNKQHRRRKTPLSCGNRPGTNRKDKPKRRPRDHYDVNSYRYAIQRACDRVYLHPQLSTYKTSELTHEQRAQLHEWRKEHRWHPHQLRHNAGTFIRREYGVEVARIILGHHNISVTELYAEADLQKAIEVMKKIG